MNILETLRAAFGGLRSNPLRSLLTVLGVVIGVTAVIVMVALGEGAKADITSRIRNMGSNLLVVTPGRGGSRTAGRGSIGSATTVDNSVVEYIRENCVLCKAVAPEASSNLAVKGPGGSVQTSVIGVTPEYFPVRNYELEQGFGIEDMHVESRERVAVLGSSVYEELFPDGGGLGEEIKIGNVRFTVIGMLKSKGQSGFMNIDDQILVPLSTAQRRLWRNERLRAVYVEVGDAKHMTAAESLVDDLLYEQLRNENAYFVSNQAEVLSVAEETASTLTLLLASIAGISLLVGGIGIMNIMMVSVTERIREIGIRKALGARRSEILAQFLMEAIALSMFGGVIGILLGFGGSLLVSRYTGWSTLITPESVAVSFLFSFSVGLFFGVYPASKASQLQPVEALRHD
ncbi:MAG: ABC transporter permease [Limnochordia bacterium]|jgi:putative ABC transport system permease protein